MMYYSRWIANGYSLNVQPPFSPAAPEVSAWVDGEISTRESHAVFGQISWQFTPTLQLVAGKRMSWDSEFSIISLGRIFGDVRIEGISLSPFSRESKPPSKRMWVISVPRRYGSVRARRCSQQLANGLY